MLQEKKDFTGTGSGGDFDSAPTRVLPNSWINAENVRTLTTDAGEIGNLESIGANLKYPNPYFFVPPPLQILPSINIYIGGAVDEPNNLIITLVYNTLDRGRIFCFDVTNNTWYIVLKEEQVTGGFTWDRNRFIHSARVINGCIYWTDNFNEPRRVDIDAGIKLNHPSFVTDKLPYSSPLSQSVITWIRRPPGLAPVQIKVYQTSPVVESNQIAAGAWTFAYRYIYRNFEQSVLSRQSTLADYNSTADFYNRIDVSMPLAEKIDQDVIQIDLVARVLNSEVYFIINSWRTIIPADEAAIVAHNVGTTALSYAFYNDVAGIALDSAYSVKLFDSAPIKSKTIEMAKNRSFQGNIILGYDTPSSTSLTLTPILKTFDPGGGTTLTGEWFLFKYFYQVGFGSAYVIRTTTAVNGTDPAGTFYFYTYSGSVPPFPPLVNSTDLTFVGNTTLEMAQTLSGNITGNPISLTDQSQASVINGASPPITPVVGVAFKSDAMYQASISFADFYARETGILTNDSLFLRTPDSGLNANTYVISLAWALSNVLALSEIPITAYYYSINITKCLRTRFFEQSLGVVVYATKDADGNYLFTTFAYSSDLAGVAIDLTFLTGHGMGYVYNVGDVLKIFVNGNSFTLSIIGQAAQYVICQLADVGSLSAITGLFEIYTPYKRQSNEPHFEVAQIYQVFNPGTSSRMYSATFGNIAGDIFLLQRQNSTQNYITEAMSPNDKYYADWFTNAGRPNFIDYIGQVLKTSSFSFSNTFIPGSQNNGLSTYDALDTKDVYPECGPIQKMQLTSKVEEEIGTIMLTICTKETASVYLGEQQLLSSVGNAFIAQATGVIGTINVLKGSFGTIHPESVYEFRGTVFFLSALNGKYIQYSTNGLFPISNYKMTRFWKLFCLQLISMNMEEIEALGSRPFVFTCVDPHNWEVLISIPKLLAIPPKGYLPDYPDMIYPFDIWDGQAKTIVYKLSAEPNHWSGAYPFSPEGMIAIQNRLFSFKDAEIYEHNTQIFPSTYYGIPAKARIMFTANQVPNRPKVYNNMSIEGNLRPSLTYFRTEPSFQEEEQYDLEEQASDLLDFNFEIKEGNLYAALYRNKIQPTAEGFDLNGLLTGNKIRALTLLVLIEFEPKKGPLELRYVNLNYQISAGHTT